jgi:hypothetical protein
MTHLQQPMTAPRCLFGLPSFASDGTTYSLDFILKSTGA